MRLDDSVYNEFVVTWYLFTLALSMPISICFIKEYNTNVDIQLQSRYGIVSYFLQKTGSVFCINALSTMIKNANCVKHLHFLVHVVWNRMTPSIKPLSYLHWHVKGHADIVLSAWMVTFIKWVSAYIHEIYIIRMTDRSRHYTH